MKKKFLCLALLVLSLCAPCGCAAEEPAPIHTPTFQATAPAMPGRTVAIDAGHQARGNTGLEPIGPGAPESKPKVSSGTEGVATGAPEHELNLAVAEKLRDALLARGYEVFMVRETNDVDISNRERAQRAAEAGADILVRIHANGSENPEDNGIMMVVPTPDSPFVPQLYASSRRLADALLEEMLKTTGANSRGVWETDTMSGINWATMPVALVEMGFMSNPAEDERMQRPDYQEKLALGMANGIDRFFEEG